MEMESLLAVNISQLPPKLVADECLHPRERRVTKFFSQ